MLTQLHIRDFAIIDAVEIEFGSGLTVLTGETGAGKSILVDALQLAIGARAGAEVIRHDAARAEVTATFELRGASEALLGELCTQSSPSRASRPRTSSSSGASLPARVSRAPTSTASQSRCKCCARWASVWPKSTVNTNSSH